MSGRGTSIIKGTTVLRLLIIVILSIPAIIHVIFLVTGSIDFLGLDTDAIFHPGGELNKSKLAVSLVASLASLFVGFMLSSFLKRSDAAIKDEPLRRGMPRR
jgi:hypothetical protein